MNDFFSVRVTDRQLLDKLAQLTATTSDLTPALEEVGEYWLLATDDRFRNEVDVQGKPLKQLSPQTLEQKRRMGRILKILQSTGLMRSRSFYEVKNNKLYLRNSDAKANKHNQGIGVPKREVFGLNPTEDVPAVLDIFDSYLFGE